MNTKSKPRPVRKSPPKHPKVDHLHPISIKVEFQDVVSIANLLNDDADGQAYSIVADMRRRDDVLTRLVGNYAIINGIRHPAIVRVVSRAYAQFGKEAA
jgi:hypothetical protein